MGGYQQNSGQQGAPVVGVTKLTIQNFVYQPATLQVKVGMTITWTNQDNVLHSVTFKNGMKDRGREWSPEVAGTVANGESGSGR